MQQEVIATLVLLFVSITVTFIIATDIANRKWSIELARSEETSRGWAHQCQLLQTLLVEHTCTQASGLFVSVMHDDTKGTEFVLIHAGDETEAYNTGLQLAQQAGYVQLSIEPADSIVSEQYDGYATLGTFNGGGF